MEKHKLVSNEFALQLTEKYIVTDTEVTLVVLIISNNRTYVFSTFLMNI